MILDESEPLARVGYEVAVPWFPGKGGRRNGPGSLVFSHFTACGSALGRLKKWHRLAEVLLRIARARDSDIIIAHMF
jgi:hypothetical protein